MKNKTIKNKILLIILCFVIIFSGCSVIYSGNDESIVYLLDSACTMIQQKSNLCAEIYIKTGNNIKSACIYFNPGKTLVDGITNEYNAGIYKTRKFHLENNYWYIDKDEEKIVLYKDVVDSMQWLTDTEIIYPEMIIKCVEPYRIFDKRYMIDTYNIIKTDSFNITKYSVILNSDYNDTINYICDGKVLSEFEGTIDYYISNDMIERIELNILRSHKSGAERINTEAKIKIYPVDSIKLLTDKERVEYLQS